MTEFYNNLYQFPTGSQPVVGQDHPFTAEVISLSGSRVQPDSDRNASTADVVSFSNYSGYADAEPISDPIEARRLAAEYYADVLDTEPSGAETPYDQDALEELIDDDPDALVGPFMSLPNQEQCDTSICIRGIMAAVLTPKQRDLLELRYMDELSPEQIARSHNMTVSELTNILNNAKVLVGREANKRGLLFESL